MPINNKSGVIGVSYQTRDKIWTAQIRCNGIRYYLGNFRNKNDAILARKNAEKALNFYENAEQIEDTTSPHLKITRGKGKKTSLKTMMAIKNGADSRGHTIQQKQ